MSHTWLPESPASFLPDTPAILAVALLAVLICFISYLLPRKTGAIFEAAAVIAVTASLFVLYPFGQAMLLFAFGANAYASFGLLMDRSKREKKLELKLKLQEAGQNEIELAKDARRLWADIALTLLVSSGAVLFYVFAPVNYAPLKTVIVFMLISVTAEMIERAGNFLSSRFFWLPDGERLIILSPFQPRDYPLRDLKEVGIESSPDLLKLHPLFTFLSSNQDYTGSFQTVVRLTFPGEQIYFTPADAHRWKACFETYVKEEKRESVKNVLPLWHPAVLKRLFWKAYFAASVKGISAYTGLLLILIVLDAPAWAATLFILLWWLFNLWISDRVLLAAADAVPLEQNGLAERAQTVLNRAGIPRARLYVTDSPQYNGLAIGMNIGRAVIMLTTATLRLAPESVEAVLAHEAVHVKKRDVLANQLARMGIMGLALAPAAWFFEELRQLAQDHPVVLFIAVYVLIWLYPVCLSFISQWMEVRADHLGAALLPGGRKQMADGLQDLAASQERDLDQSFEYQLPSDRAPSRRVSDTKRASWFWRFLEFQFLQHPPMYWRIMSLQSCSSWAEARRHWLRDRFRESLPDFLLKK